MHVVGANLEALNLQYGMVPPTNFDGDTLKLHLGREIRRPTIGAPVHFTGTERKMYYTSETLTSGVLRLGPSQCVLACTAENVRMPRGYSGLIMPTSSANRDFFSVTLGANLISAGWNGNLTLEVRNNGPFNLEIPIFAHIAQVIILRCSDITFRTTSRYVNKTAPSAALLQGGSDQP